MQKISPIVKHGNPTVRSAPPKSGYKVHLIWSTTATIEHSDLIWLVACPARFERATYGLEEFVAVQKTNNLLLAELRLIYP